MQPIRIDLKQISKWEGGQQLVAYIPSQRGTVIGSSGVTVATGVDLGQMSEEEINALDISDTLKEKLTPYARKTREHAQAALAKNQLKITQEEADELDAVMSKKIFGRLIRLYNQDSSVPFHELPANAQTVIASIGWRRGASFGRVINYQALWSAAINQDWQELKTLLNNFPTQSRGLMKRCMREAELLNGLA